MKASCLVVILLLLLPAGGVRAGIIKDGNLKLSESVPSWPEDSVVSVYFVQNMFTADEKQLLWNTVESWARRAKQQGHTISFELAGETGGLIDCAGCLTIARQGFGTPTPGQRVSFNTLRRDRTGRLISAWIGFERVAARKVSLSALMLQALEHGLALNSSHSEKDGSQ